VSFDCELHPSIFSTTTRTWHSPRISTEPMITQSAQPPLPFLTAGEGPPETARLASVTRRSVGVRGSFGASAARTANSFSSVRPARRWAETHRGIHVTPFIEAPTRTDDVVSGENDQSHPRRGCRSSLRLSMSAISFVAIPVTLGAGGSRQQGTQTTFNSRRVS